MGKSCLLLRFADDTFSESYISTIGVDFRFKTFVVDRKIVKLQIVTVTQWDTAGQERYKSITNAYYRGVDGVIVVFDLTDAKSFANVQSWMTEAKGQAVDEKFILLAGNKCDLERSVSEADAQDCARYHGVDYIETSAKTNFQVEALFAKIGRILLEHKAPDIDAAAKLRKAAATKGPCCT